MFNQPSGEIFNRPPRTQDSAIEGEITIPAPPPEHEEQGRSLLLSLLPLAGLLITSLFYLFIASSSGRSALFALPMLAMGVISVASGFLTYSIQRHEQNKRKIKMRQNYHRLLDRRMARLQAARDLQRRLRERRYPGPTRLRLMIQDMENDLWNHRPTDPDFTAVRLGKGAVDSTVKIQSIDPDQENADLRRALDLIFEYRKVPDTPIAMNLLQVGSIGIVGERQHTLPFAYMLIMQIVTLHAPVDVGLYIFSSRGSYQAWSWTHWLGHTSSNYAGGFVDTVAYDDETARDLMGRLALRFNQGSDEPNRANEQKAIIVVFDPPGLRRNEPLFDSIISGREQGVMAITLVPQIRDIPADCGAVIQVDANQFDVHLVGIEGRQLNGTPEFFSRAEVDNLARQLAQFQMFVAGETRVPESVSFMEMYTQWDLDSTEKTLSSIRKKWARVPEEGMLPFPAPIGKIDAANLLYLDLSERKDGPHGMIAGTTGSGKSVLLETLVLSLAIEHSPRHLNFLLIDFKGGATFKAFERLPHTVGTLSNIDGDNPAQAKNEALRVLEAIKSENLRRQQVFKERGVANIVEYQHNLDSGKNKANESTADWEPMPHLLIIIDEFAELATDLPNFLPELVSTVRVGRSLGMHLILAMQRPGNHVKEEMRANLQFRISLRVQSVEDSRDLLNRPEAARLKRKGQGFFQSGNDGLQLFQTAYAGGVIPKQTQQENNFEVNFVEYGKRHQLALPRTTARSADQSQEKIIDRMVAYLVKADDQHHQAQPRKILPRSLPSILFLPELRQEFGYTGWDGSRWNNEPVKAEWMAAPIGLIDDLTIQQTRPLIADLGGKGHMLVMGSPSSGKTMLLRTLLMSFAYQYEPHEIEMYVMSFSGNALDDMGKLPHVGAVIKAGEDERFRRLMNYLLQAREKREIAIRRVPGANSLRSYNDYLLKDRGQGMNSTLTSMEYLPPILVVIDNFLEIKNSYIEDLADLQRLISGRDYGIYFAVTANQMNDIPLSLQNLMVEQRIALRLGERSDYAIFVGNPGDRTVIPRPGSGLVRHVPPLHIQIALPDGDSNSLEEAEAVLADVVNYQLINTIQAMNNAGTRKMANTIATLPTLVPLNRSEADIPLSEMTEFQRPLLNRIQAREIRAPGSDGYAVLETPVGIESEQLKPFSLNLQKHGPHLLIAGGRRTGKTNILQVLGLGLMTQYAPDEVHFLLVDFKKSGLRLLQQKKHVIEYVVEPQKLQEQLHHLHAVMAKRRTQLEQQKQQSYISGGRNRYDFRPIVILIDDYEQVLEELDGNKTVKELFKTLTTHMRDGEELGLHVIVAGETSSLKGTDTIVRQIRNGGMGIALAAAEAVDVIGGRANPRMRQEQLPDGRGYLMVRGELRLIQFAWVTEDPANIRELTRKWDPYTPAEWEIKADLTDAKAHIPPPTDLPVSAPAATGDFDYDMEGMMADYLKQKEDDDQQQ